MNQEKDMMKCAVFYGKNDLRIERHSIPEIDSEHLLIKVKSCGICGTDVSRYVGRINYEEKHIGKISGHEITGLIEKKGQDVTGHELGERVVVAPLCSCGDCIYCKIGHDNLCIGGGCIGEGLDGGYAEYVSVHQKQVFKLPDNIGFEEGTLLADAVATSVHAIREKSDINIGDTVAIWGTGPQAYSALQISKLSGASVILIGRRNEKLHLASELGADIIIDCEKENVADRIREITGIGADVCLECGGYPAALTQAIESSKRGGRVVLVGLQKPQICDLENILWNEKNIIASFAGTYGEIEIGIDLARLGKLNLKSLITQRFNLDDINDAFSLLIKRSSNVIKVLITP